MADGAFDFAIKIDSGLNEREARNRLVSSPEYILIATRTVILSGIEYINQTIEPNNSFTIAADGLYAVKVHLID